MYTYKRAVKNKGYRGLIVKISRRDTCYEAGVSDLYLGQRPNRLVKRFIAGSDWEFIFEGSSVPRH